MNFLPPSNITHKNVLQELAPQGFGFYSKNPREETFYFETEENLKIPNFQLANLFGLSREGRAQAIELGKIYTEIPKDYWKLCSSDNECNLVKQDLEEFILTKDENYRSLEKGVYYIYRYEPLSWYFREFKESSTIEKRVAKVVLE